MNSFASTSRVLLDSFGTSSFMVARRSSRQVARNNSAVVTAYRTQSCSIHTSTPSRASPTPKPTEVSQPLPAALLTPQVHPRTHNIHVASLQLQCYTAEPLVAYTTFVMHAAYSLGIPVSRPVSLPITRSLYTVIKSPFVHKKSQENFEKKTHRRLIKVWDTDREVVDKWLRYVKQYVIGGVGMKAQVFEWAELGGKVAGKEELKKPSLADRVLEAAGMATRDLEEDSRIEKAVGSSVKEDVSLETETEETPASVSEPAKA